MDAAIAFKAQAKRIRAGLFPAARSFYRRVSRSTRAARQADRRFYSAFIRPGDLVFDVGVNLGQKSEVFLECGAEVVGIEPNPLCGPTLHHLFDGEPRFTLVPKALAASEGRMVLHFAGTSSTASLRRDWAWVGLEGRPVQAEVEVTTLDRLLSEHGVPQFCKIDVEGFEPEVLAGLSQPIDCVSFEYHLQEPDRLQACIRHLAGLSDVRLNAIAMNGDGFVLPNWVRPAELDLARLPAEGDCFAVTPQGHARMAALATGPA